MHRRDPTARLSHSFGFGWEGVVAALPVGPEPHAEPSTPVDATSSFDNPSQYQFTATEYYLISWTPGRMPSRGPGPCCGERSQTASFPRSVTSSRPGTGRPTRISCELPNASVISRRDGWLRSRGSSGPGSSLPWPRRDKQNVVVQHTTNRITPPPLPLGSGAASARAFHEGSGPG